MRMRWAYLFGFAIGVAFMLGLALSPCQCAAVSP